jgi:DNA-binding transcriptional LysR family regulator
LQTFAAAAELQNFTRTAEILGLTQAAVSQHVAALEKEFGASLFERTGRSVVPNDRGRRLYEYAQKILDLADQARRDVGQVTTTITGLLRIAVSTVPSELVLPKLLAWLHESHPGVRETVTVLDSAEATRAVESNQADLGIVGELPHSSRLSARAIASDELVLVVSPQHSLAMNKTVDPQCLAAEPLIVREAGSGSRRCVEQALVDAGVSPTALTIAMEMNSNEAIRAAVERGLGAAFFSRATVAREIADGKLVMVPVKGIRARRHLYVVTDPQRIPTKMVRALLDFLDQWQTEGSHAQDAQL